MPMVLESIVYALGQCVVIDRILVANTAEPETSSLICFLSLVDWYMCE